MSFINVSANDYRSITKTLIEKRNTTKNIQEKRAIAREIIKVLQAQKTKSPLPALKYFTTEIITSWSIKTSTDIPTKLPQIQVQLTPPVQTLQTEVKAILPAKVSQNTYGYDSAHYKVPFADYVYKNSPYVNDPAYTAVETLRKEYLEKYGVNFIYGNQIKYDVTSRGGTLVTDPDEIITSMKAIVKSLDRYPTWLIKKIDNDWYRLSFGIVKNMKDVQGYASSEFIWQWVFFVQNDASFLDRVFHHEFMHIIQYYAREKFWQQLEFGRWDTYNPNEFSYGWTPTASYNYHPVTNTTTGVYFVWNYAQKSAIEDQAETFADLMFRPYAKTYHSDLKSPIRAKMQYLSSEIKKTFSLSDQEHENAPWNRWIK
jgi:hypothetical protein